MRPVRAIILAVGLAATALMPAMAQHPVVISDVTIIDATGAPPRTHMSVPIERGRITAISAACHAVVRANAERIDGRGKFLIPGLWDMHVHLAKAGAHTLPLFVANGVTSVRSAGGDFEAVKAMRAEVAAGTRVGPRIKTAGPILESRKKIERLLRSGTIEPVARARVAMWDSASAARGRRTGGASSAVTLAVRSGRRR